MIDESEPDEYMFEKFGSVGLEICSVCALSLIFHAFHRKERKKLCV